MCIKTKSTGIFNNIEHVSGLKIERYIALGQYNELLDIYGDHFFECIWCQRNLEKTRDRYRGMNIFDLPVIELSRIKEDILKSIPYELKEKEKKEHPVLVHASNDSVARRIEKAEPRLVAYFIKETLTFITQNYKEKSGFFFIKAGELNCLAYKPLREEYNINNFIEKCEELEGIIFIAGPRISIHKQKNIEKTNDFYELNTVFGLASEYPKKVKLFRKIKNREKHHYIVHSKSNSIALVEDYHKEYNERGTTIVYGDKGLCDFLRDDFNSTLKNKEEITKWKPSMKGISKIVKEVPGNR